MSARSKKLKLAGWLLRVGGVFNILSGIVHIFLPTIGKWDTLFECVPSDYIEFLAVSSKEYLYCSNYEFIFICGGVGVLSLRFAHKLEEGNRMIAWFSIGAGIVVAYRATVQLFFFGTSINSIVAFFVILFLSIAYLFPVFILKEFDKEIENKKEVI
ncbi:MAG: hypothetical protein ACUZ77_08140 [Candidatus Brocadiales bacterium]